MGNKTIAVPLILILAVSAIALMVAVDGFWAEDEDATSSASQDAGAVDQRADPIDVETELSDGTSESGNPAAGSLAGDVAVLDDLIGVTDPSSPEGELIRSRLGPLTATANASVEPFPTPAPTTLYQATLAHPAHKSADLHYVESLQPLPPDLDRALAQVVLAHGVSTQMMSTEQPAPGSSLRATVTMAQALDATMPTLERYVGHPIWEQQAPAEGQSTGTPELTVAPPSLPAALLELYGSLGYDAQMLEELEPIVEASTAELPEAYQDALARLVVAQTATQRAAAQSILFVNTPAGHSTDGVDEATRDVDQAISDTPLEDLQAATAQLRAAADAARETIETTPADDLLHRDEPWVGPLGLVVVGTTGPDTYDSRLGGTLDERQTLEAQVDALRSTVGEAGVNTSETLPEDVDEEDSARANAGVDPSEDSSFPEPGWHMLVLDPGGDDTYQNNAGGVDAGRILVQADVNVDDAVATGAGIVLTGDQACDPILGFCSPDIEALTGLAPSEVLANLALGGQLHQGPTPIGVPLTAAVVDVDGDDDYEDTGPVIQGSARGIAAGLLYDADGNDTYQASEIAQGSAENYGIGMLRDDDGHDEYNATRRAQAWVDLPSPQVTTKTQTFNEPTTITQQLVRTSEGTLIDTGGNDSYVLDELTLGQGIVRFATDQVRLFANAFTHNPERSAAQLVDVGGGEHLPVPTVSIDNFREERMAPSYANVSGENQAHFWLSRSVPGDSPFPQDGDLSTWPSVRYKTAMHVDPDTVPNPVGDDAIRLGSIQTSCGASFNSGASRGLLLQFICGFTNVQTNDLLLFGEPNRVEDAPALTLTFGGDTLYEGRIASNAESQNEDPGTGLQFAMPETVVDLAGNDTYVGGNETIGYAEGFGSALLVDREGDDEMISGNRSIAHTQTPASGVGASTVAAVIDLDGRLTARSGEESQGFSSKFNKTEMLGGEVVLAGGTPTAVPGVYNAVNTVPALSLLDAGAKEDVEGPGLDLRAGNRSQGFSEGHGVAVLVGSSGEDSYHVDGWGQGFHDEQQVMRRFCDYETPALPDEGVGDGGGDVPLVEDTVRSLTPWIGGVGLLIDPSGNDHYTLDSGAGLGDTLMEARECPGGEDRPRHISMLGLGSVIDVRGDDSYEVTNTPPRPEGMSKRSCSGANATDCAPEDDKAWITIDEARVNRDGGVGSHFAPGTIGLGVDNVRNLHHLAAAACRNYDAADADGWAYRTVGTGAAEEATSGQDDVNLTPANTALRQQCDETLTAFWDAYLEDIVEGALLIDRRPNLQVALPERPNAPTATASRRAPDAVELGEPVPITVDPGEVDTEPLFLENVGQPRCEDREDGSRVSPHADSSVGCLSITRDINLGQWLTEDPASDSTDPGDTLGCNCSARLLIEPDQGSNTISLRIALDGTELYPQNGHVTTLTEDKGRWYDAVARFRVPVTATEPIQENRLRGDFVRPQSAADFPIDLAELPSGLARVTATAIVEDAVSEESGGIVPAEIRAFSKVLIHERNFEEAIVADTDDGAALFLTAPGPVHREAQPTVQLAEAHPDILDALDDEDWRRTSADNFTHELPDHQVIDGPQHSRVIAERGAPACAALILAQDDDGDGSCWTGERFVVGIPLGDDVPPEDVEHVHANGEQLITSNFTYEDSDAEPRLAFSRGEDGDPEDPFRITGVGDVWGVPGTKALPNGTEIAEVLFEEEIDSAWAQITVQPSESGVVGFAPLTPGLLDNRTAIDEQRLCGECDLETEQFNLDDDSQGNYHTHKLHRHSDASDVLGSGFDQHPHVAVWHSPRANEGPVVLDEELNPQFGADTRVTVMACVNLNFATLEEVRSLLTKDAGLDDNGCAVFTHEDELTYLVPTGSDDETRLIQLQTEVLRANGEREITELIGHLDPIGVQGEMFVSPAASKDIETNVSIEMFASTGEIPRLTSAPKSARTGSDLVQIGLEARGQDGNWTPLGDVWDSLPTPRHPKQTTPIGDEIASMVPENTTHAQVEFRGFFVDESNNTHLTNTQTFFIDRKAPSITGERILTATQGNTLRLTVDEEVTDIGCPEEDCPLHAQQTFPGAQPEAFLEMSQFRQDTRLIEVPIIGLQKGPTYNASIELQDVLGNREVRNVSLETTAGLQVDLEPMRDTLVNKTISLEWTTETIGTRTLSTFTSSYLMLPEGPCPVLEAMPGIIPEDETQTRTAGPLPVVRAANEACQIPEQGTAASLLLYALAPDANALVFDEVPVHVDTKAPDIDLLAEEGWSNQSVTVAANANDSLPTDLEIRVEDEVHTFDAEQGELTLSEAGVHEVVAQATDAAGNTARNETVVRIDRTPPTVSANVLGVRSGLALVNATASDDRAGVQDIQLLTPTQRGPQVPGIEDQSVLLSVPVEPGEDEIVLHVRDEANNTRDVRLALEEVARVESGPLVSNLELTADAADTLTITFDTANRTAPVLILDVGEQHVERSLDFGFEHEATFEGLSPGRSADVTVAIAKGASLLPAVNGTLRLPEDSHPPSEVPGLAAEPVNGGVRLTWEQATDNVGIGAYVVERNGKQIGRPGATSYLDEPSSFEEHTYEVSAVDLAGNRGPATNVEATPMAAFAITEFHTEPEAITPEEPVRLEATVQTPAGLSPDVVTVSANGHEIPMNLVSEDTHTSTYEVRMRLPALDVTAGDTELVVEASAGDRLETASFPMPIVAQLEPTASEDPSEVPGLELVGVLSLIGSAAFLRRRWTL